MISDSSVITVKCHIQEISSILALNDKSFRKFYRLYTGEKVSCEETNEARLLMVKMLTDTISKDIERVLQNERETEKEDQSLYDICEE